MLTLARGSSDHAAHFMVYLVMARLGRLVTSLPMSLVTPYQSQLERPGLTAFAFSQSGQSPDLVGAARFFSGCGAVTAAFVNDTASPLLVESLACARGFDPDRPQHLKKVTRTQQLPPRTHCACLRRTLNAHVVNWFTRAFP
jgi:fructoselysine-6-P-deglycase FrlB-like protein